VDLTPSALLESITKLLQSHFREPVWIVARLASAKTHASGFANWVVTDDVAIAASKLELALAPKINTVVSQAFRKEGLKLQEGLAIRALVRPGVSRFGKLNAELIEIDIEHAKRKAALSPQEVFQELQRLDLAQKQSRIALAEFPFNLAVIGAASSDGVRDALAVLADSNAAFRIATYDTPVQGTHAPARLIESLNAVLELKRLPDAVLLVRGGGERSDLAAFDDVELATAVCNFPIPVLCGIGHEADTTVCDLVCNHAERTPTGIASWLKERIVSGFAQRDTAAASTFASVQERLQLATAAIDRRATALSHVAEHLDTLTHSLNSSFQTVTSLADRTFQAHVTHLEQASAASVTLATHALAASSAHLDVASATITELHPHRALERGFAIITDTAGQLVRSSDIAPGTKLHAQLSDGVINATTVER
jgi:exodeoxyribonuclease VII large subunit